MAIEIDTNSSGDFLFYGEEGLVGYGRRREIIIIDYTDIDVVQEILTKMKELQGVTMATDEIEKMIDEACPVNGGGDFQQTIVNPEALKKLLTLLATRDESLMRKIEGLQGEKV